MKILMAMVIISFNTFFLQNPNCTKSAFKLFNCLPFYVVDALSSDEDDVEEFNSSYLDSIKNFATKKASQQGFEVSAEIKVCNIFMLLIGALLVKTHIYYIHFH